MTKFSEVRLHGDGSFYDLLVVPFVDNAHVIIPSTFFWFFLQFASARWSGAVSKRFGTLSDKDKVDWAVRVCAALHSMIAWGTAPGYLFPAEDYAVAPSYFGGDMPYYRVLYGISVGYFIWDIVISIYYGWGPAFIAHGVFAGGVMYLSLQTFVRELGPFFHGMFELSTPFLHIRLLLEQAGWEGSMPHTLCGVIFAVVFTVVRIFMAFPLSYRFWMEMYEMVQTGQEHSRAIVAFFLLGNLIVMSLQAIWFVELVKATLGMGGGEVKSGGKDDKKAKTKKAQ